jgi:hypothetical protein
MEYSCWSLGKEFPPFLGGNGSFQFPPFLKGG